MLDSLDDVRFRDLVLFDRVVELGTITAAARELGLPKPTASRWLAALEENLGHALVRRGARSVELTDRGRALHARLPPLLAAWRSIRAQAAASQPGGVIRVSVPVPFGRLVGGRVIAEFRRQLPAVRLEVSLGNGRVDLVRDRFDLAIRGGAMPDSGLIASRLAVVRLWPYASPAFRGHALSDIPLIAAPGDDVRFQRSHSAAVRAAVVVDDRLAVCDALIEGAGAGILPAFLGEPARAEGLLVRLGEEPLAELPVHAVFLDAQRADPRIRALIEIIREQVQPWAS